MTLREACRQTASRHAPVEIRWPALGRAFASIERQWADVPIRTPPSFELEPIRKRVAATWKRERSLQALSPIDARRLPHVLFFPEDAPTKWLGGDPDLAQPVLAKLRQRPSALKAAVHTVLRLWPAGVPETQRLIRGLAREVSKSDSLVLAEAKI